jgi:hypothetical protein
MFFFRYTRRERVEEDGMESQQSQPRGNLLMRALKGAPLSCLFLLEIARVEGAAVSPQYLEDWSGYSNQAVRQALRMFTSLGWARETGAGEWELEAGTWGLVNAARWPLPAEQPAEISAKPGQSLASESVHTAEDGENEETALESGRIPLRIDSRLESSQESTLESGGGSILLTLEGEPLPDSSLDALNRRIDENLAECDRQGIHEPARTDISLLPYVTAQLIRHHCQQAPAMGAAIWRLKNGWREKTVMERSRKSYVEGEYAQWISS